MAASTSIASGASPVGEPLTLFLIQMLLVVVTCRILGYLFKYIKQPTVIAEVITGILLGPSAFGHIPHYTATIFPKESLTIFGVIANVGLILFMFMVGLEIDTKLMSKNVGSALIISITAMVTPFLLGLGAAYAIYVSVVDEGVSFASFLLFVGVAMSITAFPVLARILTELKLLDTRVGNMALSSAAVDDVVAWCLLALVVSIARASRLLDALWTFLMLIAFVVFMMFVARPLLASIAKRRSAQERNVSLNFIVFILICVFVCSWFTEIIGVHAIFGSFILGVIVPRRNRFAASLIERIEDLVVVIFVPLYFTFSGLRTNIGSIASAQAWGLTVLVIVVAVFGKVVGGTLAAKFLKNSWRDSFTIGILMNTKGLVELIVLNVGLDVGVLNTEVFTMFVIMALFTTCMTTPLLYLVYLRKRREIKESKSSVFTVFLSVPKLDEAHLLVNVSKLFTQTKDTFKLKALLLSEISDRPSSYFFSEYYSMMQENRFTVDGKKRKALLSDIKDNAKLAGFDVETKSIASASLPADMVEYCDSHFCDVLLCELQYEVEEQPLTTSSPPMEEVSISDLTHEDSNVIPKKQFLRKSFGGVGEFVDKNLQKVLKYESGTHLVNHAVANARCAVGVLVHKAVGEKLKNIKRVVFLYTNKQFESRALKTVMRLPSEIEVTIIAPDQSYKVDSTDERDAKFIESATPDVCVVEEAKVGYDLIIIGSSRRSNAVFDSEAIKESSVPVLIIYSEATARVSSNDNFEMV